jgi:hypothetical protein
MLREKKIVNEKKEAYYDDEKETKRERKERVGQLTVLRRTKERKE